MLGRTHIMIGVGVAGLLAPTFLRHGSYSAWNDIADGRWTALQQTAEFVVAAAVGSVLPDLDEAHSLLAQKVEFGGRLLLIAGLLSVFLGAHFALSSIGWLALAIFALSLLSKANWMRKGALVVLALSATFAVTTGRMDAAGGAGIVLWLMGAAFSSHRSWTHSLAGVASLVPAGAWMMNHGLGVWASGLAVGYSLHLAADMVSGGEPLLFPLGRRRIGLRLVRSGSRIDRAIGAGMTLIALSALWV